MDWKSLISSIAPMLGTALGGPLGGMAVQAIGSALGLSATSEDAIKQAIAGATPEQMLAIKQADNDFAVKMQALGFDHQEKIQALNEQAAELDVKDRQGARDMQVANKSWIIPTIAILVTLGFFGLLAYMATNPVPVANQAQLNIMLGSLGTAWVTIMSFFFGGNHGSQDITTMLYKSTPVDQGETK